MVKHNLLKKISLGIASLVLICPLALGGISNSTVANARRRPRTHRVYRHHRRARRATRRRTRRVRKARRVVRRHHESQAKWYKHNSLRLYRHNVNSSYAYRKGLHDGAGYNDGWGNSLLRKSYRYNTKYKYGWIIGTNLGMYLNDDTTTEIKNLSTTDYRHALNDYNSGLTYLRHHYNYNLVVYHYRNSQWDKYNPND